MSRLKERRSSLDSRSRRKVMRVSPRAAVSANSTLASRRETVCKAERTLPMAPCNPSKDLLMSSEASRDSSRRAAD